MDESDHEMHAALVAILDCETRARGLQYHQLRHRNSGVRLWVDLHLLVPARTSLHAAHRDATEIEVKIASSFDIAVTVTTHLEPIETHEDAHVELKDDGH